MYTHEFGPDYTDGAGEPSGRRLQTMPWESWALHVEELTGYGSRAWVDEGYEAWEEGSTPQDFATDWLVSEVRAGGNAADTRDEPFSDPDDPSSPLLAAGALLAVALIVLAGVTLDLWWRA